jgi:hypothetical protein
MRRNQRAQFLCRLATSQMNKAINAKTNARTNIMAFAPPSGPPKATSSLHRNADVITPMPSDRYINRSNHATFDGKWFCMRALSSRPLFFSSAKRVCERSRRTSHGPPRVFHGRWHYLLASADRGSWSYRLRHSISSARPFGCSNHEFSRRRAKDAPPVTRSIPTANAKRLTSTAKRRLLQ